MNKNQLIAAHSAIPFALLLGFGGFVLTGWLPPPSPSLNADQIAEIFKFENYPVRIGVTLLGAGSPLFILFSSAISNQMRRMEGNSSVFANAQLACATIASAMVMLPAYLWLVISYRSELPRELIVAGNDLAFFLLIAAFPPLVMQLILIAASILTAPEQRRVYPRWVGFASLWVALGQSPGLLIPFFKSGPFAYSGLFGFWLIVACFGIWITVMWWNTVAAMKENTENGD